jgi:putative sigma-54 modulation protein
MRINVTGHHVNLTAALKTYLEDKLKRVARHFDELVDTHVILGMEKQLCKAEATIHVSGNSLYAEASHEDMYAAIDGLVDKLDRQVKKHKERVTDHHQREGGVKGR